MTAACTQRAEISVVSATGVYDGSHPAYIEVRSSRPLGEFADDTRPLEALAYICGQEARYETTGIVDGGDDPLTFAAVFPGMSERAVREPDGRVTKGWPEDAARREGVCFRLEAAEMLWHTLTTNEVVLPR